MRIDFISRLALLLVAGFLIVATQVWAFGTIEWLFIVGGIVMIALAAGALGMAPGPQRTLDGLVGLLGVWSIVQAIVFEGSTLQWVSFTTAAVAALLATVGLTIHETHDRTRGPRAQRRLARAGRRRLLRPRDGRPRPRGRLSASSQRRADHVLVLLAGPAADAPIAPITAPPSSVIGRPPIWGVKRPPVAALIEAENACSSFIFSPCAALGAR